MRLLPLSFAIMSYCVRIMYTKWATHAENMFNRSITNEEYERHQREKVMDPIEERLFTRFIELLNDTVRDENKFKQRIFDATTSGVPDVVMRSAYSYLSKIDQEQSKHDIVEETIIVKLKPIHCQRNNSCFCVDVTNSGRTIFVEKLKLLMEGKVNATDKDNMPLKLLIKCHGSRRQPVMNFFNVPVHIINERLETDFIQFKDKKCIHPQESFKFDLIFINIPRHKLILKREAFFKIVLPLQTKHRSIRSVTENKPYFSPIKVFPNGCVLQTYLWDFHSAEVVNALNRNQELKKVIEKSGKPIGAYKISFCSSRGNVPCIEKRSELMSKRKPLVESNDASLYLQHYFNTKLKAHGVATGCCFPLQYKDIAITFSDGRVEYITNAVAENCGCYHGIKIDAEY